MAIAGRICVLALGLLLGAAQAQLVVFSGTTAGTVDEGGGGEGAFHFEWVPEEFQWAQVGLNTLDDVQGTEPANGGSFAAGFMKCWQGGAYAPGFNNGGRLGSIVYLASGGHNLCYNGSDVYAYDVELREHFIVRDTYNPTTDGVDAMTGSYPDDSPMAAHNYDSFFVLPDLGAAGAVYRPHTYPDQTTSSANALTHTLDLATGVFTIRDNSHNTSSHPSSAYDHARRVGWIYDDGSPSGPLTRVNADTSTTQMTDNNPAIACCSAMTYDSRRDKLYLISLITSNNPLRVHAFDLQTPLTQPSSILTTINGTAGGLGEVGFWEYIEYLDRVVYFNLDDYITDADARKVVYFFDPEDFTAAPAEDASSTLSPPATAHGTFSMYQYIPQCQCIIGTSDNDEEAWAYGLPAVAP